MKRLLMLIVIFMPVLLAPIACSKLPSSPITGTPVPTATPVAAVTPSCGFTPVPFPTVPFPGYVTPANANSVIQNAAQWSAANPGVPVPAVNFSSQMILEVSQINSSNCNCAPIPPVISSVCFYSDHIEVDYVNESLACTPSPTVTCAIAVIVAQNVLVAVPQSGLPVVWVAH
jgi:hypothetical protein